MQTSLAGQGLRRLNISCRNCDWCCLGDIYTFGIPNIIWHWAAVTSVNPTILFSRRKTR